MSSLMVSKVNLPDSTSSSSSITDSAKFGGRALAIDAEDIVLLWPLEPLDPAPDLPRALDYRRLVPRRFRYDAPLFCVGRGPCIIMSSSSRDSTTMDGRLRALARVVEGIPAGSLISLSDFGY